MKKINIFSCKNSALYNIQKCLRIIFHLNNYLHLYIGEMGRGRRGPIDQSSKKPKIGKNKERGGNWKMYNIRHHHYEKDNSEFLSEDLLAEMKKMSPQDLMNILLPNQCEQCH